MRAFSLPLKRGRVGEGVAGGKNRESEDPHPNPPPFRGRGKMRRGGRKLQG
jgi:hypothetical protein